MECFLLENEHTVTFLDALEIIRYTLK